MNLLEKLIGHKRKGGSKAKQRHPTPQTMPSMAAQDVNEENKAIRFIIYGFFAPNKCIYPQVLNQKTVESIFRSLRSEQLMQMIDDFAKFTQNKPSDLELECFISEAIRQL